MVQQIVSSILLALKRLTLKSEQLYSLGLSKAKMEIKKKKKG